MTFSDEEKTAIHNGLDQIAEYCKKEIIPHIKKLERVYVTYGDKTASQPEGKFGFGCVWDGEIFFRIGDRYMEFDRKRDGNVYQMYFISYELLLTWDQVKRLMKDQMASTASTRKAIMEFKV